MAYNAINKLPQNVFTGLFRLRNLDLSNNQIEELNSSVFSACQELQYLDLSHNKLTELSPEVFSGIAALQVHTNALSFYRSQNVLCRSKFVVLDQKFIYILCQSQKFCARQKNDLHSVKLVFVPAQNFLKKH